MSLFSESCSTGCEACDDQAASDLALSWEAAANRAKWSRYWFALGRTEASLGLPLRISRELESLPEFVGDYRRGHARGLDEREVDEARVAWEKLPWNEGRALESQ